MSESIFTANLYFRAEKNYFGWMSHQLTEPPFQTKTTPFACFLCHEQQVFRIAIVLQSSYMNTKFKTVSHACAAWKPLKRKSSHYISDAFFQHFLLACTPANHWSGPLWLRLTYERADRIVELPQLGDLPLQQVQALWRQRGSFQVPLSLGHLLQYGLAKALQRTLQVSLPAATEGQQ